MDILRKIRETALREPGQTVIQTGEETLSYGKLWEASGALAYWLTNTQNASLTGKREGGKDPVSMSPVAVYGHKSPWMLVCFLGLLRSGHAYCPVDVSVPEKRVEEILNTLPSDYVLAAEPFPSGLEECLAGQKTVVGPEQIRAICQDKCSGIPDEQIAVSGEDLLYLIFTSGSTGVPKGVEITANCLNHFLEWSVSLTEEQEHVVFLNQAPFSFDLSVMDLYTCLATSGTLFCLTKEVQSDYRLLMSALKSSNASVWVSTPSFAEMCLAEPSFRRELLPKLTRFLFCGETLTNKTAAKLLTAFPGAKIFNTYGPTESTVAVTGINVTRELLAEQDPLPVGYPKPGTVIEIRNEAGELLPEGEKGEIVILGNTVSTGYYRQPDLSARSFLSVKENSPGADDACEAIRGYRTGDEGYLLGGMLYYCGRIDLQVKLHGYRIELEDIESNLLKNPLISQAVVVPNARGGKITSLTAYLVPAKGRQLPQEMGITIKEELARRVPGYMVPRKIIFLDAIPMTANGKADRKALKRQEPKS